MTKTVYTKEVVREDLANNRYHLHIQLLNGNLIHFHPDEYDTYDWDGKNGLFIVRKDQRWTACYRIDAIVGFCVTDSYPEEFK